MQGPHVSAACLLRELKRRDERIAELEAMLAALNGKRKGEHSQVSTQTGAKHRAPRGAWWFDKQVKG